MSTIKDVAALAGVSYTTVSHVVNNTRPVNDDKRVRVLAAIDQLNYVPSAVARSLKAQATATIGLLVPNNTNPYFAEIARGIEGYFRRHGYCVFLCNSDNDVVTQREYLRVLHEKRIDGLIVASAGNDAMAAHTLGNSGVPVVIVDRPIDGLPADLVQIDHELGAAIATRHLADLGHTRIGCIAGPATTAVSAMRVAGFRLAMAERGLEVLPGAIVESDFSSPGGYAAASTLFDTLAPSAIFAGNDLMGIGALRAAAERGIRVPADCSIIGFDDVELSRYVYPSLSTVGQAILRLGETAAKTLLDRINGTVTGPMRRHTIEPRLIVRESTGAPAPQYSETHSSKQ
jgi:LacI family transcriptional regulator